MHNLVFQLLDQVRASATDSFTGLGLVFYIAPIRLPVASLGDQTLFQPALPVHGIRAIARVLADISNPDSPWHDGFHLVQAGACALTHVSQYFAPPLQLIPTSRSGALPIGARHMAALAGSRIASVEYTALLSKKDGPLVFRAGMPVSQGVVG